MMMKMPYSYAMAENRAHLTLKLDTNEPVELRDFLGAFTSIGNQAERFLAESSAGVRAETRIYVKEVRHGSIEADLLLYATVVGGITAMDQALFIEDFVRRWGSRIQALVSGRREEQPENPRDLADFKNALESVMGDPTASHRLEAATFEDGKRKVKASFTFTAADARSGLVAIEDRRRELEKTDGPAHTRVLMVFTRSDVNDAKLNKRSADRVRIEEISEQSLAVMYSSELAEERVRHEIREASENIYKKGFVVDVNVRTNANGRPVVYAVTNVHDVIELPDGD